MTVSAAGLNEFAADAKERPFARQKSPISGRRDTTASERRHPSPYIDIENQNSKGLKLSNTELQIAVSGRKKKLRHPAQPKEVELGGALQTVWQVENGNSSCRAELTVMNFQNGILLYAI
jgi:hypothetical protein